APPQWISHSQWWHSLLVTPEAISYSRRLKLYGRWNWNRIWNRHAVNQAAAIGHYDAALGDQTERLWVNAVLDREHTPGKRLFRVVRFDRNRALDDDRPGIHFGNDKMHGRAVARRARFERASVRVEPLEGRQQSRMDIEQALRPLLDEPRGEQPHKAGKAHDFDAMPRKHALQGALEGGAVLAECGVVDHVGCDARRLRALQSAGIGDIGNDERDLGRVGFIFCRFDQRRHVGA